MTARTNKTKSQDTDVEELISKVCTEFHAKIEKSLSTTFDKIRKQLENKAKIAALEIDFTGIEQNLRKNSIRIQGYSEEENEDLLENILHFFKESLNINCTKEEIDCIFRVNTRQQEHTSKPRPIIVNFVSNIKKTEIIAARKLLKNKNVSVFEDLSKNKYQLLKIAKEKAGPKNAWSLGGKIYMWDEINKKKILINKTQDIENLIA